MWLALRALFWTLVLPGVFGFYLPWRFFGLRDVRIDISNQRQWPGLLCIDVGTILLLACIWEFARRGRGTLSPADPPRQLVVSGLYRFVRNPMYLSVTLSRVRRSAAHVLAAVARVLGILVRDRQPVRDGLRGADATRPVRRRLRALHAQCRPLDSAAHALAHHDSCDVRHRSVRVATGVAGRHRRSCTACGPVPVSAASCGTTRSFRLERAAEAVSTSLELFERHRFGLWAARLKGSTEICGFTGIWPFRDPPEFELALRRGRAVVGTGIRR